MHWSLEFATFRRRKLAPGSHTNRRYRSTLTHCRRVVHVPVRITPGILGSDQQIQIASELLTDTLSAV